jgi:3-dehydroquinate synthase
MPRGISASKDNQKTFPFEGYTQTLEVCFDYPVYFTRHVFHPKNSLLMDTLHRKETHRRHRVKIFLDSGIAQHKPSFPQNVREYLTAHPARVEIKGDMEMVPGGEAAKNDWDLVRHLMDSLADAHLCRHSFVLVVGGGSVLDVVGLAASLVHRGLRLVRFPSTVLSQNDAGVGVKNGIDDYGMKNFAGTFAPPFAVINDFELLHSLPTPYWIGGIAEAFKVAIIKDPLFFDFLSANARAFKIKDEQTIETTIKRCALLHMDHIRISGDPFELGSARPLDFGHWSAHRLEMLSDHRIGHGQAVAIGMALDSCYAHQIGLLASRARDRIIDALEATGLPIWSDLLEKKSSGGTQEILRGLNDFQEHLGGVLSLTLPTAIGRKIEVHDMDIARLHCAMAWLKARAERCNGFPEQGVLA